MEDILELILSIFFCLLNLNTITLKSKSTGYTIRHYDFSQAGGDGYMMGNIKFIRTAFRCNKCDKTYSIEELLEIERMM